MVPEEAKHMRNWAPWRSADSRRDLRAFEIGVYLYGTVGEAMQTSHHASHTAPAVVYGTDRQTGRGEDPGLSGRYFRLFGTTWKHSVGVGVACA